MVTVSNTNDVAQFTNTLTNNRVFLRGDVVHTFLWSPTNRQPNFNEDESPNVLTTVKPYYVGLKEKMMFDTNSGRPWRHRRICFANRGDRILSKETSNAGLHWKPSVQDVDNGMTRPFIDLNPSVYDDLKSYVVDKLFRGTSGKDWLFAIDAPVDRTRWDIKFDRTWTIRPNTIVGGSTIRSLWHPMKSTFIHENDEDGTIAASLPYHTSSKGGMGDYFVFDIFSCFGGKYDNETQLGDIMSFHSESTIYWHEK